MHAQAADVCAHALPAAWYGPGCAAEVRAGQVPLFVPGARLDAAVVANAAKAALFEALPPGCHLTLGDYETTMHASDAFQRDMSFIESDLEARQQPNVAAQIALHTRGPFPALGSAAGGAASSFVPMLVDRSPDGRFHVKIDFSTVEELEAAANACKADYDRHINGLPAPEEEDLVHTIAIGKDLFGGFIAECARLAARLRTTSACLGALWADCGPPRVLVTSPQLAARAAFVRG
jgi:hypothetical protein